MPLNYRRIDRRTTYFCVLRMPIMVQIRDVPETLHRRLQSRAALASLSLSDFLLSEMRVVAERPPLEELKARLQS